ncbi:LysR family transcriptional regulator [Caballeronia sordidicola]|uniref:Glycine cleavage system transcriptional activator n=1 Tax=Caballeronia sordidicola TaxID=196367 RepID=A0A226WUD0_CABSO|nr:LysR family transcriptional regulator [Caballeronia sordidicola]OXC74459.1 Glycine cleavage system transcriptional activator [Caballeronia sordidicola]
MIIPHLRERGEPPFYHLAPFYKINLLLSLLFYKPHQLTDGGPMARPLYLQYLPAFEAAATLGSIRGAAEALNLSPSAISLQLKKLGEATEIVLFEKSGRNVVLTQAGREFSNAVALTLSQLESIARASRVKNFGDQPASLAVSLPAALGIAWLTEAVVEFAESRNIPNLTINEASAASGVDWEVNDLAVVYDNPPFPGKTWRRLSEVRLRPVCSPILFPRLDLQHRDRKLNGITLLHEDQGEEWAKWALAARVDLQGSGRVRVRCVAQAVASAVQGRGIALVSDVLTRNHLSEGRLIRPFPTSINAACEYYILWPKDRDEDLTVRSFVRCLLDHLPPLR